MTRIGHLLIDHLLIDHLLIDVLIGFADSLSIYRGSDWLIKLPAGRLIGACFSMRSFVKL